MTTLNFRLLHLVATLTLSGCISAAAADSGWKLADSRDPATGGTNASITKTAVTLSSDPDFAGLMVRCAANHKTDVLIVLIGPLPPKTRPQVTVSGGAETKLYDSSMALAGTAVLLPDEASSLPAGAWQQLSTIDLQIKYDASVIRGTVDLAGLAPAYKSLISNCSR